MATLPLYTPPTHPDGWHRVTAPGGYETWHFEAQTSGGELRFIGGFHLGWPMHARYAQRYARYRAMPTRFRPPVPADFPVVTMALHRPDEPSIELATELARSEVSAATDRLDVRIGSNHAQGSGDGCVHLRMRTSDGTITLAAELVFRPILRAAHRWEPSPHHFVLFCGPLHDVEGEIQLFDTRQSSPTVTPLAGRGFREHRVGLRSLSEFRGETEFGGAFGERKIACSRSFGTEHANVIEMDEQGVRERTVSRGELAGGNWRFDRFTLRKLAWPVVGDLLGPRMTRG